MIELAAFDMAGTTVQEHQAVYQALYDCVVAAGARPTAADIQTWMGAGKREAITALLSLDGAAAPSDPTVDAAFADFRTRLAEAYRAQPPTPMPGVLDTFSRLRAAGIKIALTTGFDREVTDDLLATLGWDDGTIDAAICISDVTAGRPAPYLIFRAMEATGVMNVARVLVAGDTVRDLEAGTNAGAAFVIGVLSGGVDEATLAATAHTHILPSVADVPDLLAGLGQPVPAVADVG
jgi:phosphonatase-like hydrolase